MNTIGVGMLGLGTVGSAVAVALTTRAGQYAERTGAQLVLRAAVVRDTLRPRPGVPHGVAITADAATVLDDPAISIVIELMGGEEPARGYIERALASGRHVVTANKEVMAKHGAALLAVAAAHGVELRYEASAGGGIPLIGPLQRDLIANDITSIAAIINGTTNYILTQMASDQIDFAEALAQAQALGYAEADPRNDIEGIDAAYKLAILAGLAFRTTILPEGIYHEGIGRLQARDFVYADELGYAIKLLALADQTASGIQARVHPALIPYERPLAKVDGVFNAVQIEGDLLGALTLQGRGAGPEPTASAVLADVLDIARRAGTPGSAPAPPTPAAGHLLLAPMDELRTRYYLRMNVSDRPGVLARVAQGLGDENISISSVIQKESDATAGTAEIVVMTHHAEERAMRRALQALDELAEVVDVGNFIRVVD